MSGFINSNAAATDSFASRCARKLSTALRKKRKANKNIPLDKWIATFEASIISEKDLTVVLNWYIDHIGEEFVPQAYSAEGFLKKFDAIKKRMNPFLTVEEVELSPQEEELYQSLKKLSWPKGSDRNVRYIIHKSICAYSDFRNKVKEVFKTEIEPLKGFIEWLLKTRRLDTPIEFVREWVINRNEEINRWPDWSGNLDTIIFHYTHKKFIQLGCDWSGQEYSRSSLYWMTLSSKIFEMS